MDTRPDPRVVSSDRWDSGLIITFDDGKAAFYPTALLYASLSQAQELPSESEGDWLPHT
jgi:hypothetical protein